MSATRAFIVRPFGVKEGIDFEEVEGKLIAPALQKCGIEGRTTGEITRQGNIREDMFRLLVLSDIVIADVSIHNANVFYELGIRHGLQQQHTLLIRAEGTKDKYPFDLQTDRYFQYDPAEPAKKLDAFVDALRATLAASGKDSPVFQLLPQLKPHDRYALMIVPWDFQEEVERARKAGRAGDLRLLAEEARGFEWGGGGLRLVGEAQFGIRALAGAKESFEALRRLDPDDLLTNYRLGTIYQKLAESAVNVETKLDCITLSEQAIARVLECTKPPADYVETPKEAAQRHCNRAEAFSLLGSNAKTRWLEQWRPAAAEARRTIALRSPHLANSIDHYLAGFAENLDSFYPGINAFAMVKIQLHLAKELPAIWAEGFDDDDKAEATRKECERRADRIAAALYLVLGMDSAVTRKDEKGDIWKEISRADFLFLTLDRPSQVARAYRNVLVNANPFHVDTVRRNILLFRDLGLLSANVAAALDEMQQSAPLKPQPPARVVLFTGHMLDAPQRPADKARFPRTLEAEKTARRMIEEALRNEMNEEGGVSFGIAAGACGSDILFHEACESLGIPTLLFLALPEDKFQVESVNRGGSGWVERYRKLCQRVLPRVLADSRELPRWLADKKDYDIWQRNNLWMMFNALATDARHQTLIALYNRERDPDGPGGTAHLVNVTAKWGYKTVELDARKLLKS
jgi:tetratricopeptide repeat protein